MPLFSAVVISKFLDKSTLGTAGLWFGSVWLASRRTCSGALREGQLGSACLALPLAIAPRSSLPLLHLIRSIKSIKVKPWWRGSVVSDSLMAFFVTCTEYPYNLKNKSYLSKGLVGYVIRDASLFDVCRIFLFFLFFGILLGYPVPGNLSIRTGPSVGDRSLGQACSVCGLREAVSSLWSLIRSMYSMVHLTLTWDLVLSLLICCTGCGLKTTTERIKKGCCVASKMLIIKFLDFINNGKLLHTSIIVNPCII